VRVGDKNVLLESWDERHARTVNANNSEPYSVMMH